MTENILWGIFWGAIYCGFVLFVARFLGAFSYDDGEDID